MNRAPRVLFLFVDDARGGCYDGRVMNQREQGERIEDLQLKGLRIIRRVDRPGYSTDAVLLADFARLKPACRVCDLGCGIGILPLLLLGREPSLTVTGIELQEDLAALARRSVALNRLEASVEILTADLRVHKLLPAKGSFDAVLSNPPYHVEVAGGMEKHQLCCSFQDVAAAAKHLLKPGGKAFLCAPAASLLQVADALRGQGLEVKRLRLVASLPGKAPYLCLVEARQGAKPGLRLEPVLTLLESPGRMGPEAWRIYHMEAEDEA